MSRAALQTAMQNALVLAVCTGHLPRAQALLEIGSQVNVRDSNGSLALVETARMNDVHMMRMLIKNGADINASSGAKKTALIYAAGHGNASFVQRLLEMGVDISARDRSGVPALAHAARAGHESVVRMLSNAERSQSAQGTSTGAIQTIFY